MPPLGSSNSAAVPNCSPSASISVSSLARKRPRKLGHVVLEMRRAVFGEHHLLQRAGAGVGLQRQHARHHLPGRDDEADTKSRRDRLRERADMDDVAGLAHGVERGRPLAVPGQVRVAVVLENRHAILLRQAQHFGAAVFGEDGGGRVLHRRDGVDVFRRDALGLEIGERGRQRIHPHAVLVEGNADDVDAELGQAVDRALIGLLFEDHGVAARQQRVVDEVERLQRAGDDHEIVDGAGDAGVALQLLDQEFAQRAVTLRAVGEVVGGERLALALQHCRHCLDQLAHRQAVGVVVAADKAVFGQSRPARRGRG